jgi:hypothetical protein
MKRPICSLIMLMLIAVVCNAQIRFNKYVIGKAGERVPGFCISDIDLDNELEIIGCKKLEGKLVCWKNQGEALNDYDEIVIAEGLNGPLYVSAGDLNGDGFPDIVSSMVFANTINVWMNPGLNGTGNWSPFILAAGFREPHGVAIGDINGDGLNDIIATAALDNTIAWWSNNGSNPSGWAKHVITNSFLYTQCDQLTDIDNDSDLDILATALTGNAVSLWMNGGGSSPSWTKIVVDANVGGAHWVEAADLDHDGNQDIIAAAFYDSQIVVWFNLGGNPPSFRKQVVSTNFPGAVAVKAGDIDLDGDLDIVATAWTGSIVAWFENKLSIDGSWSRNTVNSNFTGAWPVNLCDLDQDGDLDIIASADVLGNPGSSSALTIWENMNIQTAINLDTRPKNLFEIYYPAGGERLRINCQSGYLGKVEWSVFDSLGRLVHSEFCVKTEFGQEFNFDLNSVFSSKGIYYITGTMGELSHTEKMFINHL